MSDVSVLTWDKKMYKLSSFFEVKVAALDRGRTTFCEVRGYFTRHKDDGHISFSVFVSQGTAQEEVEALFDNAAKGRGHAFPLGIV